MRYVRRMLLKVLSFIYLLAEYLVPKNKNCCFLSFPDISDNALALYKYAKKLNVSDRRLIWLCKDVGHARHRLLGMGITDAEIVAKISLLGIWHFIRAKHIFFTHGHYSFVRPRNRLKLINLWHGMPIKAIGILDGKTRDELQATERTIATSEYFQTILASSFDIAKSNVLITGLPRCDQLRKPHVPVMRLTPAGFKKTVIWMPTYKLSVVGDVRNDGNATRQHYVEKFLSSLGELEASTEDIYYIVKLHPMDALNLELSRFPKYQKVEVLNANHQKLQSIDFYEILGRSDGLITDISSVLIDYLVTRKPILILGDEVLDYRRKLTFDISALKNVAHFSSDIKDRGRFTSAVISGARCSEESAQLFYEDLGADASELIWKSVVG